MLHDEAVTFVGWTAEPTPEPPPLQPTGISQCGNWNGISSSDPPRARLAIVGRGRLGTALAAAADAAGIAVDGPLGRGADPTGPDAPVLLCVPDGEIAAAAA